MTSERFHKLFGGHPRRQDELLTDYHMDLAASIQAVTDEIVLRLTRSLREETGIRNLCLAGGVALNCVANGKILRDGGFEQIYIQPAAGDAGGALGAALVGYHMQLNQERRGEGEAPQRGFLRPAVSLPGGEGGFDKNGAAVAGLEGAALIANC